MNMMYEITFNKELFPDIVIYIGTIGANHGAINTIHG